MKKIGIIVGVFLLTFAAIIILSRQRTPTQEEATKPAQTFVQISPPTFPPGIKTIQPTYTIQAPTPAVHPLTAYAAPLPPSTETYAKTLAAALGFTGAPQVIPASPGSIYIWTQGNTSLTIGGDPMELSYASGASPSLVVTSSPSGRSSGAAQFLKKIGVPSSNLALKETDSDYLIPQGNGILFTLPAQATLVQVNFNYEASGSRFFPAFPDNPAATVRLNAQSEVVSATAYLFPTISKLKNQLPLISQQEAAQRLTTGEGVLLKQLAGVDKNDDATNNYTVPTSTITAVELGYYYSPGSSALSPVYVFYGTGVDVNTKKDVETTTVVSALPNVQPQGITPAP